MATTIPAIRGRMGSIEFYQGKMRARELTATARPAGELDEWANADLEDRIQRELNQTRVRQEIAPYLAQDPDRFFGSILILVHNPQQFDFEPLSEVVTKVPNAYKAIMDQVGTLTIDGGELIILDGQHRYSAFRMVIQRQDDREVPITGPYVSEVPDDELVVVFVQLDTVKTRKIFNKINKNAKSTSASDNIITSEVDGYAIVARRLVQDSGVLGLDERTGRPLTNWRTTNLTAANSELTTLTAVYQTVKDILASEGIHDFDEKSRVVAPPPDELDRAVQIASEWWGLIKTMAPMASVLSDERGFASLRRQDNYEFAMLLRPAVQMVIVKTLALVQEFDMPLTTATERLGLIDWSASAPMWTNLLLRPNGRIIARNENYDRTSALLAYMIAGERMSKSQISIIGVDTAKFLGRVYSGSPEAKEVDIKLIWDLPKRISAA